jgi:hypothetical protein
MRSPAAPSILCKTAYVYNHSALQKKTPFLIQSQLMLMGVKHLDPLRSLMGGGNEGTQLASQGWLSLGGRMNLWQDGSEVRLLRARFGLDSGYFSRQLRRLEAERLVTTDPDDGDRRVRNVRLTRKGLRERAVLDSSSNELAAIDLDAADGAAARPSGYRDGRR